MHVYCVMAVSGVHRVCVCVLCVCVRARCGDYQVNLTPSLPELDALGDEFLAEDEDSSYLDAVQAPDPPSGIPGAEREKDKVRRAGNYVHV